MANKYNKFVATAATATLVASAIVPAASANETVKFNDVKDSSEFAPYIYDLVDKEILNGYGDGTFKPNGTLNRGNAAQIVGRYLVANGFEYPADAETNPRFKDIKASQTELLKATALLADLGVINKGEKYNPAGTLTRSQMAKIIVEAYGKILKTDLTELVADYETDFSDVESASTAKYIKVLEKYGIATKGEKFNPTKAITRAQIAKFLSLTISSEELAADAAVIEAVEDTVAPALKAVETAVAALPKVEAVTADTAAEATKAVEAVTAAVEAATKVIAAAELSAEDKATAEKVLADATAAAKLVADKVAEVTVVFNVAEVVAANETTLEVKFAEGVTVTEADLKDATLSLGNGETTVTATYLAQSLVNGKAVFVLLGSEKLVDATTYEVTGSFTTSVKSVSTVFGSGVAKDFTFVTTGVTEAASSKVEISAKDQYGKDYTFGATTSTIAVELKVNGVPQVANTATLANDIITINKALVENDVVEITVVNTIDKTKYTATKTYTVGKAVTPAPTTIFGIQFVNDTNADTTSVVNGNKITLTADVRDQNGNKISADRLVTWVVEKGEVAEGTTIVADATKQFTATKAGELQITAYLANGKKATYKTTVSATAIDAVVVASTDVVNNEEAKFEVTVNPATSTVTPAELSYEVTSVPTDVKKSDVKVTFANGKTEADKNKVFAHVTTPKNGEGNYTIKFSAAGKSVEKTFASTKNTEVTSVKVDAIAENELQVNNEVVKAVKFFNKHGEEVSVTTAPSTVKTDGLDPVVFYGAKADGTVDKSSASPIKFVGITAKTTGNQSATIVSGTGTTTIAGKAVAAGKVQTLTLGSATASAIVADSYDAESKTDNVAVVDSKAYTLIPVSAVDNYGVAKDLVQADFDLAATPGVSYKFFTGLENKDVATATDAVKYIGVHVASNFGTAKTFNFEAKLVDNVAVEAFVAPKKTITVREARTLKTISLAPTTSTVVIGSKATYKVSGVDQYGIVSELEKAKLKPATTDTTSGIDVKEAVQSTNDVTVEVEGKKAGEYALSFTYQVGAVADAAKDLKLNATIKVAEADEAIKSIAVDKKLLVDGKEANADKLLQVKKEDASKITLTTTAKNGDNKVEINQEADVIYSAVVDVKDADGKAVNDVKATIANNVVTLSKSTSVYTGTVKVTATSVNGATNTITLNVSNADAVAKEGSLYFTSTQNGLNAKGEVVPALETLTFTTADGKASNTVDVFLVGVDQYSNVIEVAVEKAPVFSNTRVTGAKAGNKITLTAVAAGTTVLSVFDAKNVLMVKANVTATEADVKATN